MFGIKLFSLEFQMLGPTTWNPSFNSHSSNKKSKTRYKISLVNLVCLADRPISSSASKI